MSAVASTIRRFPIRNRRFRFSILTSVFLDIVKYVGFQLTTPVNINANLDQYALEGAHDQTKFQELLDGL